MKNYTVFFIVLLFPIIISGCVNNTEELKQKINFLENKNNELEEKIKASKNKEDGFLKKENCIKYLDSVKAEMDKSNSITSKADVFSQLVSLGYNEKLNTCIQINIVYFNAINNPEKMTLKMLIKDVLQNKIIANGDLPLVFNSYSLGSPEYQKKINELLSTIN